MDKRKYFSDLINLYESAEMDGSENEVIPQEQIADTGEDAGIQGQAQPEEQTDQGINDEEEQEMNPQMQMEPPAQESPQEVINKEKLKKLFDLMDGLHEYGEIFYNTLDNIDINLIDFKVLEKVFVYKKNLKDLLDKIDNYLINIFNSDAYDKVLYSYLLFRTELITTIKGLRDILHLNKVDKELDDEEK